MIRWVAGTDHLGSLYCQVLDHPSGTRYSSQGGGRRPDGTFAYYGEADRWTDALVKVVVRAGERKRITVYRLEPDEAELVLTRMVSHDFRVTGQFAIRSTHWDDDAVQLWGEFFQLVGIPRFPRPARARSR